MTGELEHKKNGEDVDVHKELKPHAVDEKYVKILESVTIGEKAAQLVAEFLNNYGDEEVGAMTGYAFHEATEHPEKKLTGKQVMEMILEEFKKRFCSRLTFGQESLVEFVDKLISNLKNGHANGQEGKKFDIWVYGFPSIRNNVGGIFTNQEAKHQMRVILDELLLERAAELIDLILLSENSLYISSDIFELLADKKIYGKFGAEFAAFLEKIAVIRRRESNSNYGISMKQIMLGIGGAIGIKTEKETLHSEFEVLFAEAPEIVKKALEDQWKVMKI